MDKNLVLAVLVWYLIVPPHRICVTCREYFQPDGPEAPLHKWQQVKNFETLKKCEASLRWFKNKNRRKVFKRARVSYIAKYGRCVSNNDLRQEKK